MKKLFMFLAVAGLATFGASCSSSDDNGGGGSTTLTLSADKTSVNEGDSVTFTVKNDGKAETGADLYIGSEKIANPYKFDKKGEYKVVAKKSGATDSAAVTITVTEKGVELKTLKFTADKTEVSVGDDVKFTVKDEANADVADVKITLAGTQVSNPWKATAVGSFEFTAAKDGYKSEKVTVTVVKKITSIVLELQDAANTTEDTGMHFKVLDQTGEVVPNSAIVIEGQPNPFSAPQGELTITGAPAGTYKVHATYLTLKSAVIDVVVKPGTTPKPTVTGTVVFDGKTENVLQEIYGVSQLVAADGYALWTSQTITQSWVVQQRFFTDVTVDGSGNVTMTGNLEAYDILVFPTSGGAAIGTPERDSQGLVADSANMKIAYAVTAGGGSDPSFDKVVAASSIKFSNGKNVVSTVNGDAQKVTWNQSAGIKSASSLQVASPLLKVKK